MSKFYRNNSKYPQLLEPTVTNIFILQGICLIAFLYSLFDGQSLLWYLASFVSYFFLCNVGISLTMHRLFSHRNIIFSKPIEMALTLYSTTTLVGTPISYAYMHRLHHIHSDTDQDPHTPLKGALRSIFYLDQPIKFHGRLIKDFLGDRFQTWVHYNFMLVVLLICGVVGLLSFNVLLYVILIPALFLGIVQRAHNWVSHDPRFGTRDFPATDNSRNIGWWNAALMFCGEGWANTHHYDSNDYNYGKPTGDVDLVAKMVDSLILLKLCKVNNVFERKSI
jgi:sn-1 stearoyl-lipid 9-desaturase